MCRDVATDEPLRSFDCIGREEHVRRGAHDPPRALELGNEDAEPRRGDIELGRQLFGVGWGEAARRETGEEPIGGRLPVRCAVGVEIVNGLCSSGNTMMRTYWRQSGTR